jgi:hypothetical protein
MREAGSRSSNEDGSGGRAAGGVRFHGGVCKLVRVPRPFDVIDDDEDDDDDVACEGGGSSG